MLLDNKRCLVVGGTAGVGLASARRFLDEGALVVLADRSVPRGQEALTILNRPGRVYYVACDPTSAEQVEWMFDQTLALVGGLDVLFHLPGSGSWQGTDDGPVHGCSDEGFHRLLDVHLRAVFLTNRTAIRHFLNQERGGVILNLASVLPLAPSPGHFNLAAMTASHGGLVALSRLAAARYAPQNVRVNVLATGLTDTQPSGPVLQERAVAAFLRTKQPLAVGPVSQADCAEAAVFLCSDAARSITGAVLPVDAGWCGAEGQYSDASRA